MIADPACAERGCPCYDPREGPGVLMTKKREWQNLTEEEIGDEFVRFEVGSGYFHRYELAVRAIEAKLKKKNA